MKSGYEYERLLRRVGGKPTLLQQAEEKDRVREVIPGPGSSSTTLPPLKNRRSGLDLKRELDVLGEIE